LRLDVEAHPNARADRVELVDDVVRVWVRAPAVDGRANAAIERVLAEALGLRPRQVQIVRGHASRHKVFELDLADLEEVRRRLA